METAARFSAQTPNPAPRDWETKTQGVGQVITKDSDGGVIVTEAYSFYRQKKVMRNGRGDR